MQPGRKYAIVSTGKEVQPMTRQSSSRWPEGVMTALGLLWMALFPLWQDGSYSRITHSKWIGMLLLTLVTVIATGQSRKTVSRNRSRSSGLRSIPEPFPL